MSVPDRLYYSKRAVNIVKKIDEKKFLDLDKSKITRMELFLFAMSLGMDVPIDLEKQESFVLGQSIKPEYEALLYAACIGNSDSSSELNKVIEKLNVYDYAQRCANAGFQVIEDMLDNEKSNLDLELISELDKLYEKNVKKDS